MMNIEKRSDAPLTQALFALKFGTLLIQRSSGIRVLLIGSEIMLLIIRPVKYLEGYEIMSFLASILNKHIWLAGRQTSFASQGHDQVGF